SSNTNLSSNIDQSLTKSLLQANQTSIRNQKSTKLDYKLKNFDKIQSHSKESVLYRFITSSIERNDRIKNDNNIPKNNKNINNNNNDQNNGALNEALLSNLNNINKSRNQQRNNNFSKNNNIFNSDITPNYQSITLQKNIIMKDNTNINISNNNNNKIIPKKN